MRDASINDMVRLWIGRLVETTDWPPDDEVFLALITHASLRYMENHYQSPNKQEAHAKLRNELNGMLACLPKSGEAPKEPADFESWEVPTGIHYSRYIPEIFREGFAYYWSTDRWKGDFLAALENQFWAYRDYAHGAGKGKMVFLRELAEVWIAAATTALVRYNENDKRTWRRTANMLRRHADMVEADGLRALPWGAWGYMREEASTEDDSRTGDKPSKGTAAEEAQK